MNAVMASPLASCLLMHTLSLRALSLRGGLALPFIPSTLSVPSMCTLDS